MKGTHSNSGLLSLVPIDENDWIVSFVPDLGPGFSTNMQRERLLTFLRAIKIDERQLELIEHVNETNKQSFPSFEFEVTDVTLQSLQQNQLPFSD